MSRGHSHPVFRPAERVGIGLGILGAVVLAAGLVLGTGLRATRTTLEARANMVERLIAQRLANGVGVSVALTGLQQASEELFRGQLSTIAEQLLGQFPYLSSIAYLTWTPLEERPWLEDDAHQEGFSDFAVHELHNGIPERKAAPDRPSYLPVSFLEPMRPETASWFGADALSDPGLEDLYSRAVGDGGVSAAIRPWLGHDTLILLKATYFGHFIPAKRSERLAQRSGAFALGLDLARLTADIVRRGEGLSLGSGGDEITISEPESSSPTTTWALPSRRAERMVRIGNSRLVLTLTSTTKLGSLPWRPAITSAFSAALLALLSVLLARARRLARRERADAEAALTESKRQYQDLFEGSVQGIAIHRHGRLRYANPAFARMLGVRNDQQLVPETPLTDWLAPGQHESFSALVARLEASPDGSAQHEWHYVDRYGSERVLMDSLRVVAWQGEPAIQSTLIDITERKRAEEALVAISQRALAAARAKAEFLANMSHELRTPLNGVLGMMELLEGSDLETTQREYVTIARSSGDALLGLINDVLDLSKLEAGKVELEDHDFELRPALETVLERLSITAHQKGVELVLDAPPELIGTIHSDAQRLQQILTNLVGNAVKFTEAGAIVVGVRELARSPERVTLRVSVTDSGPGISTSQRERIFDAFTQADSSTTRKFGGTGLGLAISASLVRLLGGEIGVDSEPGEGSTFWLTFTCSTGATSTAGEPELSSGPKLEERDPGAPARALCLITSETVANCLEQDIRACGAVPRVVTTPAALAEWSRRHDPSRTGASTYDLVLLDDWWMSPASELCLQLRELPALKTARFVLFRHLTETDPSATERFDEQVTAPVPITRLEALLQRPRPARQAPSDDRNALDPTRRPGHRILLVEDNVVNRKVAIGMLKSLGFSADVATNGQEAIDAAAATPYDLILMDCQMPVMDGYEASARIRAAQARSASTRTRTPIVALTANTLTEAVRQCRTAGMDDHLAKPLKLEALRMTLGRWLSAHAA